MKRPHLKKREFHFIHRAIYELMDKLQGAGICPCCAAYTLTSRAADLNWEAIGQQETIEMLMGMARSIAASPNDGDDIPEPANNTHH